MNELMVSFGKQGYLYFPTNKTNCEDAVEALYCAMQKAGINTDNMSINTCELRDPECETIDAWE